MPLDTRRDRRQRPAGAHTARVVRVTGAGPYVELPGTTAGYEVGPVLDTVGGLTVGDTVIVTALARDPDELVVIGRLGAVDGGVPAHDHHASDLTSGVIDLARLPVAPSGNANPTQLVRADDARLDATQHDHDDRYYTEAEIDDLLDSLSSPGVTWTEAGVTSGPNVNAAGVTAYLRTGVAVVNVNLTTTGVVAAGGVLFTLPPGYRPPGVGVTNAIFGDLTDAGTHAQHRVHYNADGTVTLQQPFLESNRILRGSVVIPLTGNSSLGPGAHDHDDRYYTEAEADARFAASAHNHDSLYARDTGWVNVSCDVPNVPISSVVFSRMRRVGNTVRHRAMFNVAGGIGPNLINVPAPFAAGTTVSNVNVIGVARALRQTIGWYDGVIVVQSTGSPHRATVMGGTPQSPGSMGTSWNGTHPATWASGDVWFIDYEYEAAPL